MVPTSAASAFTRHLRMSALSNVPWAVRSSTLATKPGASRQQTRAEEAKIESKSSSCAKD